MDNKEIPPYVKELLKDCVGEDKEKREQAVEKIAKVLSEPLKVCHRYEDIFPPKIS